MIKSLEKHHWQGVLALLGEFGLHARDRGFEEESNQVLIRSICTNLLEGRYIGCTIFEADNEQGMIGAKEDKVRE